MARLGKNEAELLAQNLRSKIGMGMDENLSMKAVVQKLNILTIYRPMSENSFGISIKTSSGKMFMMINSNTTRGRQHFTIAHELYHLFYDEKPIPHICGNGTSETEKNADRFAAALLMPKEGLMGRIPAKEITEKSISLATILKLEHFYSVSRYSLLIRLKELGVIDENRLEELSKFPKQSAKAYGYDTSLYEKGNEGLTIGDYGVKARLLFEGGAISEGHYLELMNDLDDE